MPLIYKDFATAFNALNTAPGGQHSVMTAGGRAYLREVRGEIRPYLDEVHWDINAESWASQHALRDKIAADPAMHGRVYAGCAGNMNLDYAAASRAPAMMLFDINPLQTVFWHSLTSLMAEMPDNRTFAAALPEFAKGLYYKLASLYDPQELFNISPPEPDRYHHNPEERQSPFRGMSYRRFGEWVEYRLRDTEANKSWIGLPARYHHLHQLAKNNAIAAVTLDVRDGVACAQVAQNLRSVAYEILHYEGQGDAAPTGQRGQGAQIGLLYRSNVGHYLRWTKPEIEDQEEHGHIAKDFSGRAAGTGAYRYAHENLRQWMAPDSHMIASDRHTGGVWGQFVPRLSRIRGLAPGG